MAQYTITIEGYESGLTAETVEQQFREQYEGAYEQQVSIEVEEE